ncbi:hypothetical protein Ancab_021896 [Ancistrocladus abbreviatus]
MAVKLYGNPASTCTTRVMACLYEKQIDFEFININPVAGEHKQSSFLAKNPFGLFPVLEIGDLTLFESRAISRYIAEKHRGQGTDLLREDDPKEAALVQVWADVEAHHYDLVVRPIIFQLRVAPLFGKSTDQAVVESCLEKLEKLLDIYESRLSTSKYLAGDHYSLADLQHLPCTHHLVVNTPHGKMITSRPHLKAWWDDISSRPAFKKISVNMNFDSGI